MDTDIVRFIGIILDSTILPAAHAHLNQGLGAKVFVPLVLMLFLCALSYGHMTLSRTARMLRRFPQVVKFPLLGSMHHIMKPTTEIPGVIALGVRDLGHKFIFWAGNNPYVIVTEAETAQKILSNPRYVQKGKDYKHFKWAMGEGLVTSDMKQWRQDRKLFTPPFNYQMFDGFLDIFNHHSRILVKILDKQFSYNAGVDENLHIYLCRATMDIIMESAMGQRTCYQNNPQDKFLFAVYKTIESFRIRNQKPWLSFFPWIWNTFGMGKEEKEIQQIYKEKVVEAICMRKLMKQNEIGDQTPRTRPFIDVVLNSPSHDYISGHMCTVFAAGFETTASNMNYTLFCLAQNPEIQEQVHAELDSIFGTDYERPVTFADLKEMKYLEMCVKESLRLYPPAAIILRHATEDIPLNDSQVIPKGVEIMLFIRDLHMDPSVYPKPEKYDPDRFLPEVCATRNPYAWLPFSNGPRNCLGMKYALLEVKAMLAHILRQFRVTTKTRPEDLKWMYGMMLEAVPSITLALERREGRPDYSMLGNMEKAQGQIGDMKQEGDVIKELKSRI